MGVGGAGSGSPLGLPRLEVEGHMPNGGKDCSRSQQPMRDRAPAFSLGRARIGAFERGILARAGGK
jgi:hypothetical protein